MGKKDLVGLIALLGIIGLTMNFFLFDWRIDTTFMFLIGVITIGILTGVAQKENG